MCDTLRGVRWGRELERASLGSTRRPCVPNPCYRPELDVLIEMEDGNYTLAKGFLPSYICDVMQTWEGLEEEDRVAIVDACATIKFDIPMGLNSYPVKGAAESLWRRRRGGHEAS